MRFCDEQFDKTSRYLCGSPRCFISTVEWIEDKRKHKAQYDGQDGRGVVIGWYVGFPEFGDSRKAVIKDENEQVCSDSQPEPRDCRAEEQVITRVAKRAVAREVQTCQEPISPENGKEKQPEIHGSSRSNDQVPDFAARFRGASGVPGSSASCAILSICFRTASLRSSSPASTYHPPIFVMCIVGLPVGDFFDITTTPNAEGVGVACTRRCRVPSKPCFVAGLHCAVAHHSTMAGFVSGPICPQMSQRDFSHLSLRSQLREPGFSFGHAVALT